MVKQEDTKDLKSFAVRHIGSNPIAGTKETANPLGRKLAELFEKVN